MDPNTPAKPTGRITVVNLTGMIVPMQPSGAPLIVRRNGVGDTFVLVFSTVERLRQMLAEIGVDDCVAKRIVDGQGFKDKAAARGWRIALDARTVTGANGEAAIRYQEIVEIVGGGN